MKNLIWILLVSFTILSHHNAAAQLRLEYLDKQGKTRIYLDRVMLGFGVDTTLLSASKVKPALNYITSMLTDKYELANDSMILAAQAKINNPTAFDIAKECLADKVFIIQIEQLWNVIRAEIFAADANRPDSIQSFVGLSVLHLFKKSDGMPIFDPAILTALQRAFAVFAEDSLMFMGNSEPYNVKPAHSLVIASVEFINDNNYSHWEVFNNIVVKSYEYVETIYEEIYKCPDWVVFDVTSRDAIYSQFNLYAIENNVAPSYNELAAMRKFGIEYYITGKVQRNKNGITITLAIKDNKLQPDGTLSNNTVKSVEQSIHKNDIPATQQAIKELAKKLVFK